MRPSTSATNSALRSQSPSMKARSSASVKGVVSAVWSPSRMTELSTDATAAASSGIAFLTTGSVRE